MGNKILFEQRQTLNTSMHANKIQIQILGVVILGRSSTGVGKALSVGYKHNQWLPITAALMPEYADNIGARKIL